MALQDCFLLQRTFCASKSSNCRSMLNLFNIKLLSFHYILVYEFFSFLFFSVQW
uniref:Uncharacterized protein n=1 Tax=Rhizophora mucronata TaxID=61149 RepID=A0A2P2MZT0_RHIMU